MIRKTCWTSVCAAVAAGVMTVGFADDAAAGGKRNRIANIQVGQDDNSADNPFLQSPDPALTGGGRDQTLQFGDVLEGSRRDDLQIGQLGTDVLLGGRGNDVQIGGIEHFNPLNRDRAFGGPGNDIFIWKPGDGSDRFDGGNGRDVIVFGLTGELVHGLVEFEVVNDQRAGTVFIDPLTRLPEVDVSGSPGFCEIVDETLDSAGELDELGLDHLVRFSIRAVRDDFEAGVQDDDNGLRVTLHLVDVETVVCTSRDGGDVEVYDITQAPPVLVGLDDVRPRALRRRLQSMVF